MITQTNVNAGSRLASLVIDFLTLIAACFGFFIITSAINVLRPVTVKANEALPNFVTTPLLLGLSLGITFYFCKDGINGRSIGKRILKQQVVRNTTDEAASPFRCFIRNLFCILCPIELIVTLASPSRRLGDIIAGTKIITYDPAPWQMPGDMIAGAGIITYHTPAVEQPKVSFIKVVIPLVICIVPLFYLALTYQVPIKPLPENTVSTISYDQENVDMGFYNREEYSKEESEALEKLYSDSLGEYLKANVKIYDTTITHSSCKSIYVVYQLKENYLHKNTNISGDIRKLRQLTEKQLYSRYPANTFRGTARYVLQEDTTRQIQMNDIGTAIRARNKRTH